MGRIGFQEEGAESRVCAEPEKGLWVLEGLGPWAWGLGVQGSQEATSPELAAANHQKPLTVPWQHRETPVAGVET